MTLLQLVQSASSQNLPLEHSLTQVGSDFVHDVSNAIRSLNMVSFDSYCSHFHKF